MIAGLTSGKVALGAIAAAGMLGSGAVLTRAKPQNQQELISTGGLLASIGLAAAAVGYLGRNSAVLRAPTQGLIAAGLGAASLPSLLIFSRVNGRT